MRDGAIRWLAVGWLFVLASSRIEAQGVESPDSSTIGRAEAGEDESSEGRPGLFAPFFNAINPSRIQRFLDRAVGLDSGDRSPLPRVPELGEPVFFDLTRPLGDRKYGNELNYLFNTSTQGAPGLQVIEFEYTFADWRSAEIDLSYFDGNLEILTPFYQRTLGVGRRRNWVHGYQVSPDLYLRSGFIGGSAVYAFGWKPEEESKFSTLIFVGANRMLIGGFHPTPAGTQPIDPGDRVYGSWRPTININVFYQLSDKFTVGFEADQFIQRGKAGESLDFPFLTYKPSDHAFFQFGGGYYRFESRDQFTVFLHLNFVNASTRKPVDERSENAGPERDEAEGRGAIRRTFARLFGDR